MRKGGIVSWIPLGLLVAIAIIGPWWAGSADAPSVAPSAAQLLPPGAQVQDVEVEGGGFARAPGIEVYGDALRLRSKDGWRMLAGVKPLGSPRGKTLWLGSDQQGRDLVARTVHGARTSLTVALLAAAVAVTFGTMIGLGMALSGWPGRSALTIFTDGALGLPRLLLLLMLGVALRGTAGGVAVAIGLASWMEVSRLVSSEARSILALPFTAAVRASGAGPFRLGVRHILPNLEPVLGVAVPLIAAEAVLLESTLSYLGVEGDPGAASWGRMIADGQRLLPSGWTIVVFPGLLLCLTAISLGRKGATRAPSSNP